MLPVKVYVQGTPKVLIWVERNIALTEQVRSGLIRKDIIPVNASISDLPDLLKKDNPNKIYLFSLDSLIGRENAKDSEKIFATAADLVSAIRDFIPERSLAHCAMINRDIENIFKKNKIPFITGNLYNDQIAVETIYKWVRLVYKQQAIVQRNFLRFAVEAATPVRVDIEPLSGNVKPFKALLKDFSLSGVGIRFERIHDMVDLTEKGMVKLKLYFPRTLIKIDTAIVSRLDHRNLEAGVQFNLDDPRMISKNEAAALSHFVDHFIIELMKHFEDITTDLDRVNETFLEG